TVWCCRQEGTRTADRRRSADGGSDVRVTPADTTPPSSQVNPWLFTQGEWDLREPGTAVFRGVRFPVTGAARRLLCRLVRARGIAAHKADPRAAIGDPTMLDGALRGHATDLRTILRAALGIANAVPGADRGEAGGYRLDMDSDGISDPPARNQRTRRRMDSRR